jgi:hypothetical protein
MSGLFHIGRSHRSTSRTAAGLPVYWTERDPMRAAAFLKTVTGDHTDLLGRVVGSLREAGIPFCVIGGQGVNAYVEPLVSLDLDLVIAAGRVEEALSRLAPEVRIQRFEHSVNLAGAGSALRVQIQTDPRYARFLERAAEREVLGHRLPVAAVEDVLQGKVWAAQDAGRRPSKRQKDMADIARLIEGFPHLRERVPKDLLDRLI